MVRTVKQVSRALVVLGAALVLNSQQMQAQNPPGGTESPASSPYMEKLQAVISDRAGFIENIVRRWEPAARDSGRWDENYTAALTDALMKLTPDNLITAGDASTFEAMMYALGTGRQQGGPGAVSLKDFARQAGTVAPAALGDPSSDMVYTAVTPCRIVDTRNTGGPIPAGSTLLWDMDNTVSFAAQGGVNSACGIPYGTAYAVAMTITVTGSAGAGYLTAYQWGATRPLASVINFVAGDTVANTTVVPVVPGAGGDFNVFFGGTTHVIIDVQGYFAAPVATALDCTSISSAYSAVPVNVWTSIDAACPAGRTATGGGYYVNEGTLGFPGVWVFSYPYQNGWRTWVDNQTNGTRQVASWVRCCRIPGR